MRAFIADESLLVFKDKAVLPIPRYGDLHLTRDERQLPV